MRKKENRISKLNIGLFVAILFCFIVMIVLFVLPEFVSKDKVMQENTEKIIEQNNLSKRISQGYSLTTVSLMKYLELVKYNASLSDKYDDFLERFGLYGEDLNLIENANWDYTEAEKQLDQIIENYTIIASSFNSNNVTEEALLKFGDHFFYQVRVLAVSGLFLDQEGRDLIRQKMEVLYNILYETLIKYEVQYANNLLAGYEKMHELIKVYWAE